MILHEHDRIVLTNSIPSEGLEAGDVGTIVHVYGEGKAFEIEFVALDGTTASVATVEAGKVRPVRHREIAHAREMDN